MGRVSNTWHDPDLRQNAPDSLRDLRSLRPSFDHARDPLTSARLGDMENTEYERRQSRARGSSMVSSDRPFPELRPKHERGPKRTAFDQAWLKEQRAAALAQMEEQRSGGERDLDRAADRADSPRVRSR